MYNRLISLPKSRSYFLFGQRGAGKSTLLNERVVLGDKKNRVLLIDLLDSKIYLELSRSPWKLRERVAGYEVVVIDEIQKVPELLNEIHKLIENKDTSHQIQFVLTGSSARKLKKAGVNLLAGRASDYRLFPLSHREVGGDFCLQTALHWGLLPEVYSMQDKQEREDFLYSYVDTYLKEEIILEQLIRQLEPFSRFLEVAAQCNGESIVFQNIARDSSVGGSSVKGYYSILEDTLLGFFLPVYHTSIRKRQKKSPKFYFYDIGVVRALTNLLSISPVSGSFEFGKYFEAFVINECIKLNSYNRSRYQFSHIRVENQIEVDLVIERPGKPVVLIEIKSKDRIDDRDCKTLNLVYSDFESPSCYLLSLEEHSRTIGKVKCCHWRTGLDQIFGNSSG